jgi:endoglucanase
MSHAQWSTWGNLGQSTTAAFVALVRALHLSDPHLQARTVAWARSQIDYALGSSGRSFVVGYGNNPPQREQHAGASCPDRPAPCGWAQFDSKGPNPQILYGGLVGGPKGPGDNTYHDVRSDYVTNEVANDYNAGFTGALAALVQLL